MNIGKRNLAQLLEAVGDKRHYIAFFNIIKVCPDRFDFFIRYFLGRRNYPYSVRLGTPLGMISPTLFSYYDILTVNEIFCRLDYEAGKRAEVIVDFGSNIGISALYFLTRNNYSRCYLFEPVPDNVDRLISNLKEFSDRYLLSKVAVGNENGIRRFGTDESGRCGGLLRETGNYIDVKCVHVNDVLRDILKKEKNIDILKIDTEGNELDIINAIGKDILPKIKVIFFEIDYTLRLDDDFKILSDYYNQVRYGNTIKLVLKKSI